MAKERRDPGDGYPDERFDRNAVRHIYRDKTGKLFERTVQGLIPMNESLEVDFAHWHRQWIGTHEDGGEIFNIYPRQHGQHEG